MPDLIKLVTFDEKRGCLTVIEDVLPFDIKRIFYIYNVDDSVRGRHRHHKTIQAVICLEGSCIIRNNNNKIQEEFVLDSPEKCLIIYPEDFHEMYNFTPKAILMVLASEKFDPDDYIFEPYMQKEP